ncbi:FAD-dependent monooxygenase [Streptomyces sp. NBC_01142]|uniref:FAD-dependent monooxygenase n=1 Tax=Streptomyces sp. NBC_01142 TaxID=2975865 RepID=UPI002258B83C|nr:FAD-dependent monooxygenase [Streptomyces sp. NBC_01142]MCX4821015.1 FAD-dependent monooxygenase [Streptomyces sp. NBC_01142]
MTALRIAIVGGGIAGLTLALASHRAGLHPIVYEKSRQPRDTETGLQLSPNAVRQLRRLGAGPGLRSVSSLPQALDFVHWREGAPLLRVPIRPAYAERFDSDHHALRRADLRDILLRLLPVGTVRLGRLCGWVDEHADGVRLTFADGTSAEADVAVGADGVHSGIRALSNPASEPVHSGMDAYRGLSQADSAIPGEPPVVRVWLGQDRHFVCYPVDSGRLINFVAVVPTPSPRAFATAAGAPATHEDVLREFAGWDPAVGALVRAAPSISRWPVFDQDPLTTWNTARTTLVGDAAHPMLPHQAQGACQGIEDAVALAELLRHTGRLGVTEALRRYAALRAPRTARIQLLSREYGTLMHSPEGAELAAVLQPRDVIDQMAETYAYDAHARAVEAALE